MLTEEELSEIAKTNLEQMPCKEFCRLGRTDMYILGFKDGYNKGLKTKINTTTISDNPINDCSKIDYAKTIIQDLLNNSDEYARQRAIDFLKEEEND